MDLNTLDLDLDSKIVKMRSKSDLSSVPNSSEHVNFHVKNESGLRELKKLIIQKFDEQIMGDKNAGVFITNYRHRQSLESTWLSLEQTLKSIDSGHSEEIISFEVQECNRFLSELLGYVDQEEVFEEIFSRFCLGK